MAKKTNWLGWILLLVILYFVFKYGFADQIRDLLRGPIGTAIQMGPTGIAG